MSEKPERDFFEELKRFIEEVMMQTSNQMGKTYIPSHALNENARRPYVDMMESRDEYVLTAELPGVRTEDIKISAREKELRLTVDKSRSMDGGQAKSFYSGFSQTFTLPHEISPKEINAKYRNGVLEIKAPKKNER